MKQIEDPTKTFLTETRDIALANVLQLTYQFLDTGANFTEAASKALRHTNFSPEEREQVNQEFQKPITQTRKNALAALRQGVQVFAEQLGCIKEGERLEYPEQDEKLMKDISDSLQFSPDKKSWEAIHRQIAYLSTDRIWASLEDAVDCFQNSATSLFRAKEARSQVTRFDCDSADSRGVSGNYSREWSGREPLPLSSLLSSSGTVSVGSISKPLVH